MEKETAQQRRNEFLGLALNSPAAQQVVGMEGIAELLRQTAMTLDMNVDKIVPSVEIMKAKAAQAAQQQQAMMAQEMAQQNGQAQAGGTPPAAPGGQNLMDGSPVVNRFSQ